jgi:hypothetical protein
MADLLELRNAIEVIWAGTKNANICFFGRADGWFRSGNIAVSSNGFASVSYAQKSLAEALQEICTMQYEKILVINLPDTENPVDENGPHSISILELIEKLFFYAPPAVTELPQLEPPKAMDSTDVVESRPVIQAPAIDTGLSVESAKELMNSCKAMLEKYYGSGADKKVHEISLVHSPRHEPKDFLDQCMALLVVMAGPEKAIKMFKPMYQKIA